MGGFQSSGNKTKYILKMIVVGFPGCLAVFLRFFFLTFHHSLWLASSEDRSQHSASRRDWWNVRKKNLKNMARQPGKPTTTTVLRLNWDCRVPLPASMVGLHWFVHYSLGFSFQAISHSWCVTFFMPTINKKARFVTAASVFCHCKLLWLCLLKSILNELWTSYLFLCSL